MFKLYTYTTCPYCEKVRVVFEEMGIDYEEINAQRGTVGSKELLQVGGKQQVPFLVDEEQGIFMYESDDIISYARARFKKD